MEIVQEIHAVRKEKTVQLLKGIYGYSFHTYETFCFATTILIYQNVATLKQPRQRSWAIVLFLDIRHVYGQLAPTSRQASEAHLLAAGYEKLSSALYCLSVLKSTNCNDFWLVKAPKLVAVFSGNYIIFYCFGGFSILAYESIPR